MASAHHHGKKIVLTGGTSGIGYEIVKLLASGNQLAVIGRSAAKLERLSNEFPDIQTIECNLSDFASVQQAGKILSGKLEHIDILINNAAVQYTPLFTDGDFDPESIVSEINTNLVAPLLLIQTLLPNLGRSERAVIMNINSGLGLVPKTSSAVYCGTKGGLNIFSQALRNQLEETNISVKQVFLPLVDTQMTQGRGSGKISAADAASRIVDALAGNSTDIDIGKAKLLRAIMRFSPRLAHNIMKKA